MFVIGKEYTRRSLHELYGGQRYGGIATPKDHPFIMIFTGDSGEEYGYEDRWEDGVFFYTGEGQKGDMQFTKGNKAILEHSINGKDLYLFEYVRSGVVRFVNQLTCIGYHFGSGKDIEGNERRTIVFHLAISNLLNESGSSVDTESDDLDTRSMEELKRIALDHSSLDKGTISERKVLVRQRALAVKKYALKRSKGICEACDKPAPFLNSNGEPFLEVHHLRRLTDGGLDHPEHVAAICPNCHRRVHYGHDGKEYNDRLVKKIELKEKIMCD